MDSDFFGYMCGVLVVILVLLVGLLVFATVYSCMDIGC